MNISIAMTTYNGMKYLEELLDSIRNQTRIPDEVVIVDDCSTDGTQAFVSDYITKYSLPGWQLYENTENLGWRRNFRLALSKCSNEIIFLCDQDDIWKRAKIENMSIIMEKNPQIELLSSDYEVLNMDSEENVKIHDDNRKNSKMVVRKAFTYGSLNVLRPGCTYCVRKRLIDCLQDDDIITAPHDAVLWGYAAIRESLFHYSDDTIIYRRHSNCASLSNEELNISKRIKQIEYDLQMENFFSEVAQKNGYMQECCLLQEKVEFSRKRLENIKKRNVFSTFLFVVTHFKYYPTFRNSVSDIYIMMKKN